MRLSPTEFANVRITGKGHYRPLKPGSPSGRAAELVKIDREMGSRYSVVIANVTGRDLVGFVNRSQGRVAQN